ncbi:MAG: lysylphosphatidylglycerol synthase transmembrane domain-containing protein [Thiogranum sp.]
MRRRRVLDGLQVLASLLLLVFAWRVAGGAGLLALAPQTEPLWLLCALAMILPMQCLSAWRWWYTARCLGIPLPFRYAIREYYVASFLNSTLPSGVAGDAARVWRHGRNHPGVGRERYRGALHAVLLERAAGQLALAVVLVAGVVLNSELLANLLGTLWLLIAAGLIVVLAQGTLVSLALGLWIRRPTAILRQLAADIRRAWAPGRVLFFQLVLSTAVVLSYLLTFSLAARAAGNGLQPSTALLVIPVVLYSMILPVSVGGLGLRELTAAGLWPMLDMAAAQGVLTALLYGGVVLAGSLPGLVFLFFARRPPSSDQDCSLGS